MAEAGLTLLRLCTWCPTFANDELAPDPGGWGSVLVGWLDILRNYEKAS